MSEQPQQPPPQSGWTPIQDMKQAVNMLVFVAQVLAAPVEVVLRTRFGARYFGTPAFCGLMVVPMWMVFWPGEDPGWLMCFWLLSLVMQLRARMESVVMVARGDFVHSRYNGWPRLAKFFSRSSERTLKGGLEPLVVILTGILLMPLSQPLGSYLVVAGIALALIHSIIESASRVQALELHDSFIEQEQLSGRFRGMCGRR